MNNQRHSVWFVLLSILVLVLFFADILIGSVSISLNEIIQVFTGQLPTDTPQSIIILQSRLPKALTAILAGCALPVAGLLMQTFFRNPVAGPDILGVSAGSSLLVALVMLTVGTWFSMDVFSNVGIILAAIVGAMLVLFIILGVAARVRDSVTLLIFGLMFGMAISAVVGVLQYYSSQGALKLFIMWTFGSLSGVTWSQLYILAVIVIIGLLLAVTQIKALNLLLLGEQYATSLGLNIRKSKIFIILTTGLLTGAITAFCGPIAFIGIAVPHLARMIFKVNSHAIILPASVLLGICILLICDIIAQTPGNDGVLPINAITAFMGAPFIIYIIWKNQHLKRVF
ncbi:MAG: iron ABC transporter permease [Chitinophagaceae bacterium]|jgi:iron complex transport system permease protein|nr:iron ABC transporter permease [Bacteroidota bacterium]MBK9554699.1 iron ABC transporter permease [Bacteroidota bacterium]MBL0281316.1 iron ABC transporter permease [Bacteroidota bacterium]MBP9881120.1 iron ABC transporter permease [Chitinophagales bacterium]